MNSQPHYRYGSRRGGGPGTWKPILASGLAVLLLATPASPQVISGRAVDADSGEPVEGVLITLLDSRDTPRADVVSDSAGKFIILVPARGTYVLQASRLGYETARTRPIRIAADEALELELQLHVRPVELEGLAVVVRRRETLRERDLREFRERVERYGEPHLGSIRIFTGEFLKGWEAFRVEDLFKFYPPRFRRGGSPCQPRMFLDGRPLPSFWGVGDLYIWDLEGVELHTGFGPVESRFWDPDGCGVILVWSKPFVAGEPRAYLGVVTGSREGEPSGTARYFRGFYEKGRFTVDRDVQPAVFPYGQPLDCLSSEVQARTVTVDSLWPYRPPAWDEPDLLVTAQPAQSSEDPVGALFWTGEWEIEQVAGREVTLDSAVMAVVEFETQSLWEDALAQLPDGERDVEMRIERDEVRAFGPDLVVVERYPVIDNDDRRGSFFLVYSHLAGYVLHRTFGHPEWHPDATLTAIRPYLYFRIEGDAHLYALAARAAAWEYADWVILDVQTGAAVLEAY
ncbi:MAG: carboxypeptidase-like regulatory domain-containing protein [Gemmatimonadales bacterium]